MMLYAAVAFVAFLFGMLMASLLNIARDARPRPHDFDDLNRAG